MLYKKKFLIPSSLLKKLFPLKKLLVVYSYLRERKEFSCQEKKKAMKKGINLHISSWPIFSRILLIITELFTDDWHSLYVTSNGIITKLV